MQNNQTLQVKGSGFSFSNLSFQAITGLNQGLVLSFTCISWCISFISHVRAFYADWIEKFILKHISVTALLELTKKLSDISSNEKLDRQD